MCKPRVLGVVNSKGYLRAISKKSRKSYDLPYHDRGFDVCRFAQQTEEGLIIEAQLVF